LLNSFAFVFLPGVKLLKWTGGSILSGSPTCYSRVAHFGEPNAALMKRASKED
jgi:hypothetical protein